MRLGLKIRFQSWVMLATGLLVVTMAFAFLVTAFRTFSQISEEHAISRFDLIADQASDALASMIRQHGRNVIAQTRSDVDSLLKDNAIRQAGLADLFLASLEGDPTLYSRFIGLANEEFFQIIAVRGDARVIAALKAPPQAYFAVRHIQSAGNAVRTEHYRFLDKNRQPIGELRQEGKLMPTQRPWYGLAISRKGLSITDPYVFASNGELGITVAAPLPGEFGVLATDISLRSLQQFVAGLSLPPNGAITIQDTQGRILAFHGKGSRYADLALAPLTPAEQIAHPYLEVLRETVSGAGSSITTQGVAEREKFVVTRYHASVADGAAFRIVILAPLSDFTAAFKQAERDVVVLSLVVLLFLLPLAFVGTRQVARSLATMADASERLKRLDFSHKPVKPDTFLREINSLGEAQFAMHDELQKRTRHLVIAQSKLENLIQTGLELGRERDRMALLGKILFGGRDLLHCDAGTLYLVTERKTLRFALRTKSDELPSFEIPLFDDTGKPVERYMSTWCATHNSPVIVDDVYTETRFDVSGTRKMDADTGYRSVSMLTVPLAPREGEVIAVLQFLNALDPETGEVIPFDAELIRFVNAMAAQAAVALDNFHLIEAQKNLMDSLIKLIAGAIDTKSPYTGGHCERVPALGIMLAEAATASTEGSLAAFGFKTEEEWREFRIGAWLHDCGKVTTPEYVVDKATKLETIHNRIHEIRTRFEVLLRDARIEQLEAVAAGLDPEEALDAYEARKAQLADDFAFIAECNLGGEFMAPEKIERLKLIATQTWLRHYDNRIGLAHEELKRYTTPPRPLPTREYLLADKPEHVIPRTDTRVLDPKWGFKVKVPENLYNHGELHNLAIGRGTLTEEERFKVNEHVIQSLMMLEQLPLPRDLKRVPEYAGTHHETLIGTGYPRRLAADELTVPMRIMAIADIFEALTASDRPYKKAKTLSESIKILHFFKKDKHIDPELFDLFLKSGIYLRYAEKFLMPEQIDAVDISQYVD